MGRLTAWMARRQKRRGSSRALAAASRSSRLLSFERCEQRIALSTNAGFESVYLSDYLVGFPSEGGTIYFSNDFANLQSTETTIASPRAALTNNAFDLSADHAYFGDSLFGGALVTLGTGSKVTPGTFENYFDGDFVADSGEVLVTDTRVTPIPPPMSEPGGNEGGQIPMTAFMGPSTLGLPSASNSMLAGKERPALKPESLQPAPGVSSAVPGESLRGRAVVYEVAQLQPGHGNEDSLEEPSLLLASREALRAAVEPAITFAAMQTAHAGVRGDGARVESTSNSDATSTGFMEAAHSTSMAMIDADATAVDEKQDDSEANAATPMAAAAAAHDAAFEEWQRDADQAAAERNVLAATADAHQRRMIGGALIAVAAVPVTKALRRRGQQATEDRPRDRRQVR